MDEMVRQIIGGFIMREHLAAFTPAEDRPSYISINWENALSGGIVEITVRSKGKENGELGDVGLIRLSERDFIELWNETKSKFQAIQLMKAEGEFR